MSTKNTKNTNAVKIVKSLSIVTDKKTGEQNLVNDQTGKVLSENWTNYIRAQYKKYNIFSLKVNDAEEVIQKIHKSSAIPLVRLRGTFRHDLTDKKYQDVDTNGIPTYIREKESIKAEKEKATEKKRTEKEKQAAKKANTSTETKKTETKQETKKTVKKYCPDDNLEGMPDDIKAEMQAEGLLTV